MHICFEHWRHVDCWWVFNRFGVAKAGHKTSLKFASLNRRWVSIGPKGPIKTQILTLNSHNHNLDLSHSLSNAPSHSHGPSPWYLRHYRLRCIRPPQSQSRTNNWSTNLHGTNRINSWYTKSIKIFFGGNFLIYFLLFGVFSCLKTLFSNFHQENLSFDADIEIPYCKK